MNLNKVSDSFWSFLENNKKRIQHILGTDILIDRMAMLTDIYMPAMVQHQKVFPKYKGINRGRTVVAVGTGPTLDYYNPISGAVHMGMNNAIYREDIKYDYYFNAHYDDQSEELFKKVLEQDDLVKFFVIYYRSKDTFIPEYLREQKGVETIYVDSYDYDLYGSRFENARKFVFPLDISVSPIKSYGTTFYGMFQFALWTHPEKIYIVGADCSKGYARCANDASVIDHSWMVRPWRKLAEFAKMNYPDIEIIALNPVGAKGIFKDEYTAGYGGLL